MVFLRAIIIFFLILKAIVIYGFKLVWKIHLKERKGYKDELGRSIKKLLEDLGPTFIKAGQLLSTRRDLFPPEVLSQLVILQDNISSIPFHFFQKTFRNDFKIDIADALLEVYETPIASGSIASVFKGKLNDGRIVALKVIRPNVARKIEQDIRLMLFSARFISFFPLMRNVPIREIIVELSKSLSRQINLEMEAVSNLRLTETLRFEKSIKLPVIIQKYCSKSILTMEYIEAIEIKQNHFSKSIALVNGLKGLYRMIFLEGFIHCDMHPGNFHLLENGKVVLLDFGMISELSTKDRITFAEFFYAMVVNDGYSCTEITLETAIHIPKKFDKDSFSEEVVFLVNKYSGKKVTGFHVSGFVIGMFDIQRKYKIRGTSAFIMAIISLLVFEGVAKNIDPELDFQLYSLPYIQEALKLRRKVNSITN